MADQKSTANVQALYEAAVVEYQSLITRIATQLQDGIMPTVAELLEEDRIRQNLLTTRRAAWQQAFPFGKPTL